MESEITITQKVGNEFRRWVYEFLKVVYYFLVIFKDLIAASFCSWATVVSYRHWHDMGWAIIHGWCGAFYVIYHYLMYGHL